MDDQPERVLAYQLALTIDDEALMKVARRCDRRSFRHLLEARVRDNQKKMLTMIFPPSSHFYFI
ncbi:hypothetical protein Lqui_1943 [Legionella quinlivanii]|uniref:Uncharacterized protein n=1 Tax=Legionella quinlivanii TaxID=45073 RepID=A0A0W0XZI3_9GAMM|nr:hypothetical protein [Legionella quinlivanii]KTD49732.1 hypothetical protein Lqui_1943 [Legionella quinlivanii]MCW8451906.1 hypothetical protein [Legionella quinlivanii]SEG23561.1 hypothetical protein SAMN02746093_02269 [Legionella quinlivanii DSM 21216]STY09897.1 Uncharacterised protein [Legionella quinlivanii]